MNLKEKNGNHAWLDKYAAVLFVLVVTGRTFFTSKIYMATAVTGADEIGTIASAAYFAGCDWTEIMADTLYYGFGYSMLLAPVFRLFQEPSAIHHMLLFVNNLLIGLCGVLGYRILTGYFGMKNRKCAILTAAMMVLFFPLSFNGNLFMNETMLSFLILLVLFFMLRLNGLENGWRKNANTILLSATLCYSLLVHTRSLVLVAVTIVVVICMLGITRQCMVNAFIFFPFLAVGGILSQIFVKVVQSQLWSVEAGNNSELVNSTGYLTVHVLDNVRKLFSYQGLKLYLMEILGQIYTMTVFTYGINIVAFVGTLIFLRSFFRKKTGEYERFTARELNIMTTDIFSVLGVAVTMAASSLAALAAVEKQMEAGTASKWFLYSRYWSIYMLPVILLGGYFFIRYHRLLVKLFVPCLSLLLAVAFLFSGYLGYRFDGQKNLSTGVFYPFFSIGFWTYGDTISDTSFFKITLFVLGVFLLVFLLIFIKKLHLALAGICVLLAANYVYGTCQITLRISDTLAGQFTDVQKLVQDSGYDSEFIYTNGSYSIFKLWLQDLFPHQKVVYHIAESGEAIAITDQVSGEFFGGDWKVVHADRAGELLYKDLYVFVRGGVLTDRLAEIGYPVCDVDLWELTGYFFMPFAKEDEREVLGGIINGSVEQHIMISEQMAASDFRVEMHMATYMRENQGVLRLEIIQGANVLSFDIDKAAIVDNEWLGVDVRGHCLEEGEAVIRITDSDNDSDQCVTVYTIDTEQLGDLYFQGMKNSRKLDLRIKELSKDRKEEELL